MHVSRFRNTPISILGLEFFYVRIYIGSEIMVCITADSVHSKQYRGADKFLDRPWQETSYSDQTYNTIPRLEAYKQHKSWYCVVSLVAVACFLAGSG